MAYYTLVAKQGFLARMTQTSSEGLVPMPQDLRQAESWADAQVNQFIVEMVGAYNAATTITAFVASTPPEIQALAYLYGSAWVWDKYALTKPAGEGETEADRLRRLAGEIEARIRKSGYVTTSAGALYSLSGKRKRGIVVEDPGARGYPMTADYESYGETTRHNLETIFKEANVEAPIL